MKLHPRCLLTAVLWAGVVSAWAGPAAYDAMIPTRDVVPHCWRHFIDRRGTQVFSCDPVGAAPRDVEVVYFDVVPAREFQRVPLHLVPGEIALITATGNWETPWNRHRTGPEGTGEFVAVPFAEPVAAPGSLIMDVHWAHHSDRYAFAGPDMPITVHGPCSSLTFISNDQLTSDEFAGVQYRGALHVKVELPYRMGWDRGVEGKQIVSARP